MNDRRKALEAFTKQLRGGDPLMEDFVKGDNGIYTKSYQARDLAEEALAKQVLDSSDVPVPGKGSSRSKAEDFFNRILSKTHPEITPDVRIQDLGDYDGSYSNGIINVDKNLTKKDLLKSLSGVLHEGGHQYDDKVLKFDGSTETKFKDLAKNAPQGRLLQDIDPAQAYEIMAKGHHAEIPNLREGSFGLGGLKSMLKSGTFRSVAGALPLAGTAMALSSGDANAAMEELPGEVPVLGTAYEAIKPTPAGSAEDDYEMKNEVKALQNYGSSPAANDRNQSLRVQALSALVKK